MKTQNILAIIADVQTAEEAAQAISNAYPKLSKQAAQNVVKDLQDFREQKIDLAQLEYYLTEAGL